MDILNPDTVNNLVWGVAGNALTSVIYTAGKVYKNAWNNTSLEKKFEKDSRRLEAILGNTIDNIVDTIEWEDKTPLEVICVFLQSPEVESVLRQVYTSYILDSRSVDSIREEFISLLSVYIDQPYEACNSEGTNLFNVLLQYADSQLDEVISQLGMSALEAKSSLRFHIMRRELESIRRNIDFLRKQADISIDEINHFETEYREIVFEREKYIRPPFIDQSKKFVIDDVYVHPRFSSDHNIESVYRYNHIAIKELIGMIDHTVILGDPGAGKSTFTQKLCHDIALYYEKRLINNRRLTPVRVILRDYGEQEQQHGCSILEYIENTSKSTYQIKAPHGGFEYLLSNGRLLVLFDGLDELTDAHFRQEITDNIETFCVRYPSTPVVVTSRVVGYDQAPLNKDIFSTFYLAAFNKDQIREYVEKWFNIYTDDTKDERTRRSQMFLTESENLDDIRSNPLMLALMCNIYRGENYIPRNRPAVYEKCAEMLFERWDKGRGITIPDNLNVHLRKTMMYLAHWMYSTNKLQGGVSKKDIVDATKRYLYPKKVYDIDEAEQIATELTRYCTGRAWVFTDVGTTGDGERLYHFTHRTFLEYFTARYLTMLYSTPQNLVEELGPRIIRKEWDVVCQLAFHIMSDRVEDASDQIVNSIIPKFLSGSPISVTSFLIRCLDFLLPSYPVLEKIITLYMRGVTNKNIQDDIFNTISWLLRPSLHNKENILIAIAEFIKKELSNKGDKYIEFLEIIKVMRMLYEKNILKFKKYEDIILDDKRIEKYKDLYLEGAKSSKILAWNYFMVTGDLSLLSENHSIDTLFSDIKCKSFEDVVMVCPIYNLLFIDTNNLEMNYIKIRKVAEYIIYKGAVNIQNEFLVSRYSFIKIMENILTEEVDQDIICSPDYIIILCAFIELAKIPYEAIVSVIKNIESDNRFSQLLGLLLCRFNSEEEISIELVNSYVQEKSDKNQIITDWINGRYNFINTDTHVHS